MLANRPGNTELTYFWPGGCYLNYARGVGTLDDDERLHDHARGGRAFGVDTHRQR